MINVSLRIFMVERVLLQDLCGSLLSVFFFFIEEQASFQCCRINSNNRILEL